MTDCSVSVTMAIANISRKVPTPSRRHLFRSIMVL